MTSNDKGKARGKNAAVCPVCNPLLHKIAVKQEEARNKNNKSRFR